MSAEESTANEHLPVFKTLEECLDYCKQTQDNFYLTSFMIEAWIGMIICRIVDEYASMKSGNRHLQTGVGRDSWEFVFGDAKPSEWWHIFDCFQRFCETEARGGETLVQAVNMTGFEDKHGSPVSVSGVLAKTGATTMPPVEIMRQTRYTFRRISDWIEAIVHWQVHHMAALAPISFQPTEDKRELASIGLMQGGYSKLSPRSKEWWQFRHEDLAKRFGDKPEWKILGQAQSFEKWGTLKQPDVDELTIHWWPLLMRYGWTDRDMMNMLKRVVPHPEAYPLREDKEFADYRKKALGLIKGKAGRDKSSKNGEPEGWRVALAMIGRLSE